MKVLLMSILLVLVAPACFAIVDGVNEHGTIYEMNHKEAHI